jgi:hypothetical protein
MLSKAIKIQAGLLLLILFSFPRLSHADWAVGVSVGDSDRRHHDHGEAHHFYRWHDHPHYGYHMHFLPDGYFTIWAGGVRYYYYDGLYYSYVGDGDYVLVNPPMGAYVSAIPSDFQPVIVNGVTYYVDNGVYYVLTHHGYKVVPAPVVYAPPVIVQQPQQVVVAQPAAPVVEQDSFTVNVPNDNGGYVPVVIKKSGNGYAGPQGEIYPTFPSVAQLKVMYAKQK